MSERPKVSVAMAAYNGARLLGPTIDSLLDQTMPDWELVVVDDSSSDDTLDFLHGYDDPRIRVFPSAENGGPVRARNRAVSLATGRHIAGLDQDDLCHPQRFARQLAWLDEHPDCVLVGTAADHLQNGRTGPGFHPGPTNPALIRWLLLIRNPIVWSSVMIRGTAARALAPFSRVERLFAEDFDLYHRLAGMGSIARIDEPLLLYRVHAGGASNVHEARMSGSAAAVLAEAYAPALSSDADAAAVLISRHLGGGQPADDLATLERIATVLDRLFAVHAERFRIDRRSLDMIVGETSRLWWLLVAKSVRAGLLPMAAARAIRPAMIDDEEHEPGGFLASRVIGAGRSLVHRHRHA